MTEEFNSMPKTPNTYCTFKAFVCKLVVSSGDIEKRNAGFYEFGIYHQTVGKKLKAFFPS